MPLEINGLVYYRTKEACNMAGINKNTFLRWVTQGSYPDVTHRDRRGWRLFTGSDVEMLKSEANKIRVSGAGSEN